jgi:hypothetical protein
VNSNKPSERNIFIKKSVGSAEKERYYRGTKPVNYAFLQTTAEVILKDCVEDVTPILSAKKVFHYVTHALQLTEKTQDSTDRGKYIMQIMHNTDDDAPCSNCGQNLAELGSFIYTGITINGSRQKDEECQCKKCGQHFILQYSYFDDKGHINAFVFNGDVNDPSYNWQDQLTPDQRKEIGSHLKTCKICMDKLTEETLSDAWLAYLLHNGIVGGPKI